MTAAILALGVVAVLAGLLFILYRVARATGRQQEGARPDPPFRSAAGLEELVLTVEEAVKALDERIERMGRLVVQADAVAVRLVRAQAAVAAVAAEPPVGISEAKPRAEVGETHSSSRRSSGSGRASDSRQRQPARSRVADVAHLADAAGAGDGAVAGDAAVVGAKTKPAPAPTGKAPRRPVTQPRRPTAAVSADARATAVGALPGSGPSPCLDDVYRLDDAGLSPQAIASHLCIPRGEVQLMVGLRRLG